MALLEPPARVQDGHRVKCRDVCWPLLSPFRRNDSSCGLYFKSFGKGC